MAAVASPRGDLRQKVTNDKHLHFTVKSLYAQQSC